tara:strand:- start:12357 stop:13421 length:1065 start_codon:yes stop_codon:yes gene_type:complete
MNIFNTDKALIISEIGINHDGSLDKAKEMIRVSAECGADICKFQLLIADQMYSKKAGNYVNSSGSYPIYNIIRDSELGKDWIPQLRSACEKHNVGFLMTICDLVGLEQILHFQPSMLKIASSEISYLPLFREIGKLDVPLIFSSAASTLGDIEEALNALGKTENICLMHCNGKYPTPPEGVNINVLKTYSMAFPDLTLGFSDHTEDPVEAPVAALGVGAKLIEKHFTLDKNSPGPDHSFAVDPEGLKALVSSVRKAEKDLSSGYDLVIDESLLGSSAKKVTEHEKYLRDFCYRSIFSSADIQEGDLFSEENLIILRNGEQEKGLHPRELHNLIGNSCPKAVEKGTPVNWETLLK